MKNNLVSTAGVIIVITILGKISGFFRELTLSYYYGASSITDAYITATVISSTIFATITGSIVIAYIPTFNKIDGKDILQRNKLTSEVLSGLSVFIILLSLIAMLFSKQIILLFAVGFDEITFNMAVAMLSIILPFSVLLSVQDVLGTYLQCVGCFWVLAISGLLSNLVVIISIIISEQRTITLALGYAFSFLLPVILAIYVARRKQFKYNFGIDLSSKFLKELAILSIPIFFGRIVLQLNTIVDRNFASTLGTGIMSAMQYANKLNTFFITLFVISIATAIFPTLSQQANNDLPALKKTASGANNIILLFAIPITVAILLLGNSIVELVFMRGAFSQESADITANALKIYALGLPALSLAEILNREFYALKDTKAPVVCSVASISTNIILNFLLVKQFGYMGLALSTSIAAMVLALLLFYKLHKKIGEIGLRHLLTNCSKMTLAAIGMGTVVYFLDITILKFLPAVSTINRVIALAVTSIAGAGVYGILVYLLGIREVRTVITLLKEKLLRKFA